MKRLQYGARNVVKGWAKPGESLCVFYHENQKRLPSPLELGESL